MRINTYFGICALLRCPRRIVLSDSQIAHSMVYLCVIHLRIRCICLERSECPVLGDSRTILITMIQVKHTTIASLRMHRCSQRWLLSRLLRRRGSSLRASYRSPTWRPPSELSLCNFRLRRGGPKKWLRWSPVRIQRHECFYQVANLLCCHTRPTLSGRNVTRTVSATWRGSCVIRTDAQRI